MKRAPRIAAIQDLSGLWPLLHHRGAAGAVRHGRAVLSHAYSLPVRPTPPPSRPSPHSVFLDLSDQMSETAAHWAELGVTFDAIYSGFLGSAGQDRPD